jgi:DNA-binding transcriptional LysR family regulator
MNEIDLRRLDLNLLVVFEVLMAERSVTRAAERLGRTQSAVSHALARLREQVGDPLLVKTGGRMAPSPFAETLAEEVRPILRSIQRVLVPPRAFVAATSTRVFRVAIPDFATSLFPLLAAQVRRAAPLAGLEWVVPTPHTPLAVAEGQVDIALGPAALPVPDGLEREQAGTLKWATFARRDHPAIAEWGAKAWARWPHVAVRTGSRVPSPVATAAGALSRERRVAVWVPSFAAVAPLLAQTDLIATLPLVVMHESLERFGLRALPSPVPVEPMPHAVVWSRRLSGDPAVRWIRDVLCRTFAEILRAADAHAVRRVQRR